MKIYLIAFIAIVLFTVHHQVRAGDWSVGYMAASWHMEDDYRCEDERRDFNESNNGLYIKYKALIIGRYDNSQSGCDGAKYSNFVGLEAPLWSVGPVDFSIMGAIADGDPDDGDGFGEHKPVATLNAQWSVVKIFYGVKVAAIGLQWDFE